MKIVAKPLFVIILALTAANWNNVIPTADAAPVSKAKEEKTNREQFLSKIDELEKSGILPEEAVTEMRNHLQAWVNGEEDFSHYDYLSPIMDYLLFSGNYDQLPDGLISDMIKLGAPATSIGTPLHAACLEGSVAAARKALRAKMNPNAQFTHQVKGHGNEKSFSYTPLKLAILLHPENFKLVQLLLKSGAKPDSGDTLSQNGLQSMLVKIIGSKKTIKNPEALARTVQYMLEAGVSAEGKTWMGSNGAPPRPLWYACKMANVPLVEQLLKHGADANFVDQSGGMMTREPYLHAACGDTPEQLKILSLLLKGKADPKTVNAQGETACQYAESKGYEKAAQLLHAGK